MIPSEIAALATALAAEQGRIGFENEDVEAAYRLQSTLTDMGYLVTKVA